MTHPTIKLSIDPVTATAPGLDSAASVARLTINRAEKSNALDLQTLRALVDAVTQAAQDPMVRALVVTGAGERAFVGGADIRLMSQLDETSAREFITAVHQCCNALREFPAPVIARINGVVFGAGLELAASADLLVSVDDALFGMPEVKLGIPSVVEAAILPGIVGWPRTREMLLLGDNFSAATAYEWGLLHRVVPRAELDGVVSQWLDSLLANGPQAVRDQKTLMRRWERLGVDEAVQAGIDAFEQSWRTDEPRRMMQAWTHGRK
ncbi:MAG: enoyl-CoA hydratase [Burkholderiaceae bacterium]